MGKHHVRWFVATAQALHSVLVGAITVVVVVFGGFAFAAQVSGANESGIFNRNVLIVESGSMSPSVKTGDVVVVKNVSQRNRYSLQTGDVVTFKAANNQRKLITHRIVAVRHMPSGETFYTTKGDANEVQDSALLTPDRVVGEVEFRVPRLGYVISSFDNPEVILRLVSSLALLAFAAFMFRISRNVGDEASSDAQPAVPQERPKDPPKRKVKK